MPRDVALLAVGDGTVSRAAGHALSQAGFDVRWVAPSEALSQPVDGAVAVIQADEGWRHLAERLEAAGAAVVVLGAQSDERFGGATLDEIAAAAFRAQGRRLAIGDSRRARVALEQARAAQLVNRFGQSIAAQPTLADIVRVTEACARELCDAQQSRLLLIDSTSGELVCDAPDPWDAVASDQAPRAFDGSVAAEVARSAQARLVANGPASIIAAPLIAGGDVLGVLEAVRIGGNAPFDASHLRRLVDLAPHVAIAVRHAQVTDELMRAQRATLEVNAELERKVAERTAQIGRAKKEWERTFDAIADPIALMDGFVVRRANLAYAARVGVPVTRVPGQFCHQLLAGRATPCPGCPLADDSGDGEICLPDGTLLCAASYRIEEGEAAGAVVVHYRDVTAERRLEQKLRESELMAAVGQLASGAAHEINNPLGFVASNLQQLRTLLDQLAAMAVDERGRAELSDGVEMVLESMEGVRRVAEIVKGLRELSRLEIGRPEPSDVDASCTRALRAVFGQHLEEVQVDFRTEALADIAPLQLDQALTQLLKNARQAGGRVTVRTWSSDDQVHVAVSDEGCGIRPEHLPRIFEPFFTTRPVGQGLGLGLTVAWGIVRRAGGHIDVESEVGRGSTFTLHVPRHRAEPADRDDRPAIETSSGGVLAAP